MQSILYTYKSVFNDSVNGNKYKTAAKTSARTFLSTTNYKQDTSYVVFNFVGTYKTPLDLLAKSSTGIIPMAEAMETLEGDQLVPSGHISTLRSNLTMRQDNSLVVYEPGITKGNASRMRNHCIVHS